MIPHKNKVRPWQPNESNPDYPCWYASPIHFYDIENHGPDFPPTLKTVFQPSKKFNSMEEALAYYESPEYHSDYVRECHHRANQLREVAAWLDSRK